VRSRSSCSPPSGASPDLRDRNGRVQRDLISGPKGSTRLARGKCRPERSEEAARRPWTRTLSNSKPQRGRAKSSDRQRAHAPQTPHTALHALFQSLLGVRRPYPGATLRLPSAGSACSWLSSRGPLGQMTGLSECCIGFPNPASKSGDAPRPPGVGGPIGVGKSAVSPAADLIPKGSRIEAQGCTRCGAGYPGLGIEK
jgi:hypothetical protein